MSNCPTSSGVVLFDVGAVVISQLSVRQKGGPSPYACPRHAGAVDRLADQRVGPASIRSDDHVVGLGDGNLDFVGLDRLHVLAVRLHDCHRQAGNADLKAGHRRGINQSQPDALASRKEGGPIVFRPMSVDEIGIGYARHIRDVGWRHPHAAPAQALLERLVMAGAQPVEGLPRVVEIIGLLLQLAHDGVRHHRAVVGEHDHLLAIVGDLLGPFGVDHDRSVMS
jgi:hypothetical protein